MRKKMLYLLAIAAVSMGFISSCGHDSPQGDEPVTNGGPSGGNSGGNSSPGDGHRPGLDEFDQYDRELKDDVLRVKGGGVDLRYDRGGVLFASDKGVVYVSLTSMEQTRYSYVRAQRGRIL